MIKNKNLKLKIVIYVTHSKTDKYELKYNLKIKIVIHITQLIY